MPDHDIDAPEDWRPVPFPDYAGLYEVSSLGRVRRAAASPRNSWKAGRLLKPTAHKPYGHLGLSLYRDNKRLCTFVHTLVAIAFLGPRPSSRHEVAHDDGDAANNRVGNLRWATSSENKADMRRHKTMVVGERHYNAKLTAEQIAEIRALYAAGGITQREIGARFGVHRVHIGCIVPGKKWAHV